MSMHDRLNILPVWCAQQSMNMHLPTYGLLTSQQSPWASRTVEQHAPVISTATPNPPHTPQASSLLLVQQAPEWSSTESFGQQLPVLLRRPVEQQARSASTTLLSQLGGTCQGWAVPPPVNYNPRHVWSKVFAGRATKCARGCTYNLSASARAARDILSRCA